MTRFTLTRVEPLLTFSNLFLRLLGKNIARGLPTAVKNLARAAEG